METRYFVPRQRHLRTENLSVIEVNPQPGESQPLPRPNELVNKEMFLSVGARFLKRLGFNVHSEGIVIFYQDPSFSGIRVFRYCGQPYRFYARAENYPELVNILEHKKYLC